MSDHTHLHNRHVKPVSSAAMQVHLREWGQASQGLQDPEVRRANLLTQLKVLIVYLLFVASVVGFVATQGHWVIVVASIVLLGLVAMPFLRIYMHTQAHWKFGNGPVRNWLLDHGMSLLMSIPQTGYKYGHLAHHRYDNDFDARGFPKDLQSTYIFSKNGRPTNIWLWCAFYMFVYQHVIHLFHVLNASRRREIGWYVFESLLIVGFHVALFTISPAYYLVVFLPCLLASWLVSAVTLYMMHAVDLNNYHIHPTLNSRSRMLNSIGDNAGYHIEHSLYPNVHHTFLGKVNALLKPPEEQELKGNYVTEGFRMLMGGHLPGGSATTKAKPEVHAACAVTEAETN